jgi:predicted lipoprotein with Yx(FWY)xxD motif
MRTAVFVVVLLALATASASAADQAPVVRYVDDRYGLILATPAKKALYTWSAERDFNVHCTGACAKAWPPLIVKSAAKRITGIKGTFGTIRRPDGRRQLTFNRRPVYTYAHEGPKQVLCDNVNGWFVVQLR